jgi:hypothetical protein
MTSENTDKEKKLEEEELIFAKMVFKLMITTGVERDLVDEQLLTFFDSTEVLQFEMTKTQQAKEKIERIRHRVTSAKSYNLINGTLFNDNNYEIL